MSFMLKTQNNIVFFNINATNRPTLIFVCKKKAL